MTKERKINRNKKRMSTKKKILLTGGIVLSVLVIIALGIFLYVSHLLSLINYVPSSSTQTSSSASSIPMPMEGHVYNIMLLGIDSRNTVTDPVGRSDSMILISINTETKKIVMTSFMRDMYVEIPGHHATRLNAAYQYGGPELLLDTIEQDFQIKVDRYVTCDFFDFMDIIDKLGGVTIDVTEKELPVLNSYVKDINKLLKLPGNDGLLPSAGIGLSLTGKQALGYSRIRYVGNADFKRTERQRTVLTQVISKMKGQNILQLNSILTELLPDITTNVPQSEIGALLWNAPAYLKYEVVQCRIPKDGTFEGVDINGASVLSVNLEENIAYLNEQIYAPPIQSLPTTTEPSTAE